MNILIVGNVLKDVYLNLDTLSNSFEPDRAGVNWLDVSFDATTHNFFSRTSSFGGAAVTMNVLKNLGLDASISDSDYSMNEDARESIESTHRYILVADGGVSYLSPKIFTKTTFSISSEPVDYIFIDRSANLDQDAAKSILGFLAISAKTKLVVHQKDLQNPSLNLLADKANLVFTEYKNAEYKESVFISESQIVYKDITEPINTPRIDMLTHLSAYSIITSTILGCFILGKSTEESLRLARINVENSTLSSVLSLRELETINANFNPSENLELIAASLLIKKKGILAADESGGSIKKKFAQLDIEDTLENRHDYRDIFFTTPDLENYVSGVILFDETARDHAANGETYVDYLTARRIIPGIKVDQGLESWQNTDEKYTKGLDGLETRLREYYAMGLRFAKWRAAFELTLDENGNVAAPTAPCIEENCRILAEYAKKCQSAGIVPIVEPELVYDGYYPIEKSAETTGKILDALFETLKKFGVNLRACILKVNMVLAGKKFEVQSTPAEVGQATTTVLKNHVPTELAGVVFLSGGQTVEQATDNLAEVEKNGPFPWPVTFSFARALQDPALFTWKGDNDNADAARAAFRARLVANTEVLPD